VVAQVESCWLYRQWQVKAKSSCPLREGAQGGWNPRDSPHEVEPRAGGPAEGVQISPLRYEMTNVEGTVERKAWSGKV